MQRSRLILACLLALPLAHAHSSFMGRGRSPQAAFCNVDAMAAMRGGGFLPSWPSESDRNQVAHRLSPCLSDADMHVFIQMFSGMKNKLSQMKASLDGMTESSAGPKASKLAGKWTKVKEVNQDEAMLQVHSPSR